MQNSTSEQQKMMFSEMGSYLRTIIGFLADRFGRMRCHSKELGELSE